MFPVIEQIFHDYNEIFGSSKIYAILKDRGYIIPYFYTNVKNRLYHLCDTLVSDLFFPCFIPLYQGSSPVGRCLSSDRLQVWNYAFLGHKKRPGNGFSVTRSGDLPWNCSKRGKNAPKNAKMMVYKKRLIDHHTWCRKAFQIRTGRRAI